ncbi:MAG: AmmeMemoRadiSam system protein A [Candidatus Nealsonbacteria bacterium CG_4_9_14_0_2_um_filter_37_38]|uniref:AmmeMemoRadiSam system protein A n=1 Tax=Candidatus Nealsonbacteria bacterium CG_4_10_14_0_8_um_filter_37_14 TaxID=1974684 RepID=A0A2M7R6B5_9BACT|nr:MAG: AmmeMemoRadiSam system protein A [Candidatus Nealsonbacteria bacterium CG11_big_fil_rev_8_21_14_0_20_37_68]PIW92158.1 MAG: AmmeMemoRadiSam system protein A [Candidatus Nealsonbacteria bacterium CG_4_8_14_3_um_filter_37_23]PIY88555.1 MAG: AmmeMemoRadiSam system protein A [Candidatus Nealsonbacteria bacterium CG_4_10_14_0_8_um_filter_37_14]PJC51905.1 MAG: AmmeMemoRadiSam system protein A [Candidatus Nealsonbacteria bacterium CG_4_9_14_0_2_um_filter_37_38]
MNLVNLAKKAVETYVVEEKIIPLLSELRGEFLDRKSGTFVTIEKNGQLRGCIGTYLPTKENIAKEVIHNAIAAATEDYRFGPIRKEELPQLSYTVYILNEPELIKSIKELDPKKYGIIVKTIPIVSPRGTDVVFNGHMPHKSGLLLPDLEGVDTVEQQISIACQKGGINPIAEKIVIYKFTVEKYE